MHENFLNYIMIGLSRGLFPSATHSSSRFDEEAYLMQEAAALRREKRAEAARQRPLKPSEAKPAEPKPAELQTVRTKAAPESGVGEPAGRQRIAFWAAGRKSAIPVPAWPAASPAAQPNPDLRSTHRQPNR